MWSEDDSNIGILFDRGPLAVIRLQVPPNRVSSFQDCHGWTHHHLIEIWLSHRCLEAVSDFSILIES